MRADRLDGTDITGWAPSAIARAGLVKTFQTSRPFASMSFLENVWSARWSGCATSRAARERSERCLEPVGLADKHDMPSSGASTGQRKRLEIARALATSRAC